MKRIENPHKMESVGPEVARCFVALNPPAEVRKIIARRQALLRSHFAQTLSLDASHSRAIRWVKPEQLHLTLLFLGDVRCSQLDAAKTALQNAAARIERFELNLGDFGCFPNAQRPRVLWAGLNGDMAALGVLQSRIATSLKPFVAKPEDKAFRPHLTIARIKPEDKALCRRIGRALASAKPAEERTIWNVETVDLMRSVLKPSGPEYSVEHSVRLDEN